MPRIVPLCAALVVGAVCACAFEANYAGGRYRCSDGKCPSGLTCAAGVCVPPDAPPIDGDAAPDARVAALTCADPGLLGATGGSATGTTANRSNTITSMCGGFVTNGPDAVYRITTVANVQVMVAIAGSYPVNAYLIAPCSVAPATPACEGNALASATSPITVTVPVAGEQFVVVDGVNPSSNGTYTLTVTVP
jgi:hypothetical protein